MNIAFNMKQPISGASVVAALALAALTGIPFSALAEKPVSFKVHCLNTGNNPPEALGDRKGHSIAVGEYTCRVEGGALDGGVMTGTHITEWDGVNGLGKAGFGVTRTAGGKAVYVNTEMKSTLTVKDGKVTGFIANGRGYYAVATGAAESVAGKTYSYISKPSGPGQFIIETTLD